MRPADYLALAVVLVGGAVAVLLALGATEDWPRGAGAVSGPGASSQVQITRPFGQAGVGPLRFDKTPPFMPVGTPVLTWPRIPCAWERLNDVRALRCPVRTVPSHMGES